jgi:hypothetical protein
MDKICPADPSACSFAYDFTVAEGGTFYLTANFSTWQMNQDLRVSVNGATPKAVPVFYTVGWWNETQPLEVTLTKGKNNLNFTRASERTITFKSFVLHSKKPDVPAPFPPYTPAPAPPPSAYHQVPPTTTCEVRPSSHGTPHFLPLFLTARQIQMLWLRCMNACHHFDEGTQRPS